MSLTQESNAMKESKGKPKKTAPPRTNASQPSLKGLPEGPSKPKK